MAAVLSYIVSYSVSTLSTLLLLFGLLFPPWYLKFSGSRRFENNFAGRKYDSKLTALKNIGLWTYLFIGSNNFEDRNTAQL